VAEIRVPKLNSNDTTYTIVEWIYDDGAEVPADAALVMIETSKATTELTSPCAGYLRRLLPENAECRAGDVIGHVAETRPRSGVFAEAESVPTSPPAAQAGNDHDGIVITRGARERMAELDLTAEQVRGLGRKVVRAGDIESLAVGRAPATARRSVPVTVQPDQGATAADLGHQQAVAEVVARSHATIPPAFVAVRVTVNAALAASVELTSRLGAMVGLPELTIRAMAKARADVPVCFASLGEDGSLTMADAAHVGVTMDVGRGLTVPVIRDADVRPFPDIAGEMFKHRMRAIRRAFREEDLAGANIMLALNNDGPVEFAVPIIFPGTACAVSLGGIQPQACADSAGSVRTCKTVVLGMAHDHRIVNGRQAAALLTRVKSALESPGWLSEP
jgi:2-oxoglutarate dehydrogenase E2 component (dihydrolipoamide succinyltransferase)